MQLQLSRRIVINALIVIIGLLAVPAIIAYAAARLLRPRGGLEGRGLLRNAALTSLVMPLILLGWNTRDLLRLYTPRACGSWWLGASPEECTLGFYLISRTAAAVAFMILPCAVICFVLTFVVFRLLQAPRRHAASRRPAPDEEVTPSS